MKKLHKLVYISTKFENVHTNELKKPSIVNIDINYIVSVSDIKSRTPYFTNEPIEYIIVTMIHGVKYYVSPKHNQTIVDLIPK